MRFSHRRRLAGTWYLWPVGGVPVRSPKKKEKKHARISIGVGESLLKSFMHRTYSYFETKPRCGMAVLSVFVRERAHPLLVELHSTSTCPCLKLISHPNEPKYGKDSQCAAIRHSPVIQNRGIREPNQNFLGRESCETV